MAVTRISVRDLWITATRKQLRTALEGAPEGGERQKKLDEVAAWVQSQVEQKPAIAPAVRAAVEHEVETSLITEREAQTVLASIGS